MHTLDFNTASTIVTSLVDLYLDHCNFLYYSLSSSQLRRLQSIQNTLARDVSRTLPHTPITSTLQSFHYVSRTLPRTPITSTLQSFHDVSRTLPHTPITSTLQSFHWLKIEQRIKNMN